LVDGDGADSERGPAKMGFEMGWTNWLYSLAYAALV